MTLLLAFMGVAASLTDTTTPVFALLVTLDTSARLIHICLTKDNNHDINVKLFSFSPFVEYQY